MIMAVAIGLFCSSLCPGIFRENRERERGLPINIPACPTPLVSPHHPPTPNIPAMAPVAADSAKWPPFGSSMLGRYAQISKFSLVGTLGLRGLTRRSPVLSIICDW